MAPKFGTSGLRGLVTELTPGLVAAHVRAFLAACPHGQGVHVGWDLRPSSPDIAAAVIDAVRAAGLTAHVHGALPTPALALASIGAGQAAVMITGSHIPADRNGLKFYLPGGEISKADEGAILAALDAPDPAQDGDRPAPGTERAAPGALQAYGARYVAAFGPGALEGLRIGVYEHSSVARDILGETLRALGAGTEALSRSDIFVPVDTEAVDPGTRQRLAAWAQEHGLDAIVSTDGDGDRPMVTDETGRILPGDLLGPLSARMLGAEEIVTPVSSNTCVSSMPDFYDVHLTRIGSPYVIAAMEDRRAAHPGVRVAGYEANGGFLLGFAARGPAGPLAPLMTRDSLLPIVAPLAAARAAGQTLSALAAELPPRFTAADRIENAPTDRVAALIATLSDSAEARAAFFTGGGAERGVDLTDGVRVTFEGGAVVHLRPSGNAPECRCYGEADSPGKAAALVDTHLARMRAQLRA